MRTRRFIVAISLVVAACATPASPPPSSPPGASDADEPRRQVRLDTDAWTQAMTNESGQEIHVRNKSNVPIIVTEVILSSCMNLVEPCGSHFPRVRIEVGDARRVMRIRYGGGANSNFLYSYRVEPADPERNR
ncbi:MAG TPA: hypothetical protein VFR37_21675 [Longimicrobium sp.]|nr:hypothetical protein [Longimicrobium sp.]